MGAWVEGAWHVSVYQKVLGDIALGNDGAKDKGWQSFSTR